MAMHHETTACPVCDSRNVSRCVSMTGVPVYCNVLYASRDAALGAATGDIDLYACSDCGHLYNASFDNTRVDYSLEYENSLHYSGRFQEYASALADDLIRRYELHGKTVVELACGKGDFLADITRKGAGRGVGFDPSYVPGRLADVEELDLTFIQDYYSDKYTDIKADMVCCRHALEHIESPQVFLKSVRQAIGRNTETAIFFEVPNAMYTLKDMGIWDIIYEHCGYFCENSLVEAFTRCGFDVQHVRDAFGGQFLSVEAFPRDGDGRKSLAQPLPASETDRYASAFEERYQQKVDTWNSRLADFARESRRVVVWGAGSKGVTFLNVLKARDAIGYIVDLNPHKHGKYVPGTGHRVVSPQFLAEYKPDTVIVMNPLYLNEIRISLASMGVEADVMVE
jgi:SAM-dependent methyltransferase